MFEMERIIISIIVPVYNVEKYLRQCLDSITAQTFTDWECILVDDGSKDKSGSICDEYAKKDNRFKVIHKPNGGVSTARNMGLEKANGEWLTFCDSDDILEPDALEKYMNAVESSNADIIRAGYREVYPDGSIKDIKVIDPVIVKSKCEMLLFMESSHYYGFLWNTLYHRSTINNIRFATDISWCEDHLFSLQAYIKGKSFYYIPDIVYNYYKQTKGSLSYPKNPYMIVSVANLEYEVKQKLVDENVKAINETEKLYQSKIGKAFRIALNTMTYIELQSYYKKSKEQVKLFDGNNRSKYLNLFYKSRLPFFFRVHLIRLYLTLKEKK